MDDKARYDSERSDDAEKPVVVVGWEDDDPEVSHLELGRWASLPAVAPPPRAHQNPFNWPRGRKYANVLIPIYICLLTAANSTSTGIMSFWGPARFHTTRLGFQFSVTSYLIAFSFASLVTAPLSELFGRKRIYQVATLM